MLSSLVHLLSAERVRELGFTDRASADVEEVAVRLRGAGISLSDADHLFSLILRD